ncbi:MAG: hypothetical protein JWR17_4732 [Pseudomonas sp.]|uniref:Imm49 family immunity protein n=1 Tax=Pseudomonas sp. TaxID=306 RepID=UPI0026335196|nr:Imm49 family immunity protein [Pseudomonas sp.]MDB6051986.1 hypothetical protein [Pseudomonas sp.]
MNIIPDMARSRLEHIDSHLDGGFDIYRLANNVETGQGDPAACSERLASHAYAKGMHAWFRMEDLYAMKEWFYISGRLNQYASQVRSDKMNFLYKMLEFMRPLVSDNQQLIDWFCQFSEIRDVKRIESVTTPDYTGYQIVLAVKGEWELLSERCLQMSAKPPKGKTARFLLDNEFFAALAKGDIRLMEGVLAELISPKQIRARASAEGGYSEGLISTFGVIFSKIAWRHGYEVKVDSPYIPAEWLPVKPLSVYDPHYRFLK